ncbi:HEPN domain protein [Acidianus hospitalis W1]|uniref:HEPN domain protein n=1 Tax=Acidianus hospitalis (strain W1) TaxID=933801 RepID=F4B6Y6_ACIHW|nr:HEPN domain-containing protein [Acidianus hospitalis]AEE94679.1 HEPN domain protein [Acidianus hospitalis W1]
MAKWFEKSDKEVAYLLLEKGYYPEACFHSEMAVELKLKGILVEATRAIIYTHSIKRLLKEVEKVKKINLSDKILDCADYLSYLGSRYPEEEIIELGRSEGEKCVRCMEEILSIL